MVISKAKANVGANFAPLLRFFAFDLCKADFKIQNIKNLFYYCYKLVLSYTTPNNFCSVKIIMIMIMRNFVN